MILADHTCYKKNENKYKHNFVLGWRTCIKKVNGAPWDFLLIENWSTKDHFWEGGISKYLGIHQVIFDMAILEVSGSSSQENIQK